MTSDFHEKSHFPSPPYLPEGGVDPGIPPKHRRVSIRERGLIIATLVFAILGACNVNLNVRNDIDELRSDMEFLRDSPAFYWDDDDPSVYSTPELNRTPAQKIAVDGGTVVWAATKNDGNGTVTITGFELSGLPDGVRAIPLGMPQDIVSGQTTVVAVFIPDLKMTDEQLNEFSFDATQELLSDTTDFVVREDGELDNKQLELFKPHAQALYKNYAGTNVKASKK